MGLAVRMSALGGAWVRLLVRGAADPALRARYDLVMALECVHDVSEACYLST